MVFGSVVDVFSLIQLHGYWVLLLATIIEGPVATAAGSFAASIGLLNLFFVILIAFSGDIIADTVYFYMGRKGKEPIIDKYGHKFGLSQERMKHIEKLLKNHFLKTLAVIKITPMLAPPGIMMIGASKTSFKKFIFSSLLIIIPASLFFAGVGYYMGLAADSFFKYYKLAKELLLALVIVVIIFAFFLEKKLFTRIAKRIEKV